ncbi:hypothetical protein [Paracoccus jiaweipingae]|uniref:hypothetical protein n=1 Tax=unclassified Paracoccus (in: a-proteobacteria) TaxID=2688777 RepID=UPI0037933C81
MVKKADKLDELARVANLKAEQELRKYAAFRANMQALHQRLDGLGQQIGAVHAQPAPQNVAQLRAAADQAHRLTQSLLRAEAELAQLQPRFDAMRQQAASAWGRVEVLRKLADQTRAQARAARQQKARGLDSG